MSGHSGKWPRLGAGTLPTEDMDTGLGHIVSTRTYNYVFASLLMLTFITVWAASHDFGIINLGLALFIATLKASVVTLMFMHLNFESKIFWGIVIYPLFIFVLILLGTLGDETLKERPLPMTADQVIGSSTADVPKSGSETNGEGQTSH